MPADFQLAFLHCRAANLGSRQSATKTLGKCQWGWGRADRDSCTSSCLGPHVVGTEDWSTHTHKRGHWAVPGLRLWGEAGGPGHWAGAQISEASGSIRAELVARHFRKRLCPPRLAWRWQLILCLEQLGASFSETFKVGQLLAPGVSPNSGGYETALLLFSEVRWRN